MTSDGANPRIVAIVEILLCSSVPTQLLIGSLLRLAGWLPLDEAGQLSLPFVLTLSVADTLLLIGLMVVVTRAHGERVVDLWLGRRPSKPEAVYGALLIPVVFFLVVVLMNLLRTVAPWLHNVPTNPLERLAGTPAQAAMFAVVTILSGGVREELQRAFLLRRFQRHLGGTGVGVVVLSIAFGLGHLVQGWDAAITTGLLGAFWAVLYLRRRSAMAPLVSHAGFNALEVLRVAIWGA
ncbi:MAG: CPBP family intramembrane metalloprotease [Acidobacteria bacterium]|nr:CPBP family intramembrane metalloprotease [Acidobacteriota bacterium]